MTKSSGGSVTSSDSDLEIEDDEPPEPAPAMISISPPTDERAKAVFDAVQATWAPRNKVAPVQRIKAGVVKFGETIKALRDSWKNKNDSLKKAELPQAPDAADVPRLKLEVTQFRQSMENLVNKTIMFAHPAIIHRYVRVSSSYRPSTQIALSIRLQTTSIYSLVIRTRLVVKDSPSSRWIELESDPILDRRIRASSSYRHPDRAFCCSLIASPPQPPRSSTLATIPHKT